MENNYEILLTSTVHDPKRMELSVRRMIERRVDGVAILTFGMEESLIQHLRFRKVPLVFVDVGPDFPGVSNIRINYQSGIRQGVQHLAALGHRQIAFITGPLHLKSAQARRTAFEKSMEEIGLAPELIVEGDHTMEGGMRLLTQLVRSETRPTAVMCSNDMTAIGVMREAYDQGIKVPQDLSLIGFDDIRLAQFIIPPLSTIRMSQTELARIAFESLISETERQAALKGRVDHELDTSLVLRRSTARARTSDVDATAE